ncbi:hypothetical protein [Actinomadura sp. 9N407]|uniref:hypothetical protein n=1 Tax=Actinomadura sp. 9N407 TaxID=3375154 RepID=UPI00378B615D
MIIWARPHEFGVTDPDDFTRFHVECGGLTSQEFAALLKASHDVEPHEDQRHVWVSVAFLHVQLGIADNTVRRDGLQRMLAFAAKNGWLNPSGTHIAAHIKGL